MSIRGTTSGCRTCEQYMLGDEKSTNQHRRQLQLPEVGGASYRQSSYRCLPDVKSSGVSR